MCGPAVRTRRKVGRFREVFDLRRFSLGLPARSKRTLAEARRRDAAVVGAGEQASPGREDREGRRGERSVVAVGHEAAALRARVARRIEDDEVEAARRGARRAPARRRRRRPTNVCPSPGATPARSMFARPRSSAVTDASTLTMRAAPAERRGHAERARVGEQVRDAGSRGHLAHPPPVRSLVEEEPRREAVAEAYEERHRLLDDRELLRSRHAAHRQPRRQVFPARVGQHVRLPRPDLQVHAVEAQRVQAVEQRLS